MELGEAMRAIKLTILGSLVLLTACTPRPSMDVSPTYTTGGENNYNTSTTGKSNKQILTENAMPGQAKSNKSASNLSQTDEMESTQGRKTASSNLKLAKTNTKVDQASAETAKYAATSSASAISSWQISGAMAARSNNKGWNAAINWMQRGMGQYQIRLFGPLGSGTVLINKQGGVVTYRDGPKSASSSNAEELLKRQTGMRLPVNYLYYWVRGLPAPGGVQLAKRDPNNHLMVLKQAGYTIEYGQYTPVGNAVLPRQIKLQGNGVFIKLVIKRWQV
jgi:outer membrane lipoprotein LolB